MGTGKKRKAETTSTISSAKRQKQGSKAEIPNPVHDQGEDGVITINRAPVLDLWASCVAELVHPSLSWETCLSIGGAISTITAISKGRSIGTIEKPDPGEAHAKKEKRKEKAAQGGYDEIEVMSFHLNIDKDGHALVGGKPKKASEETLRKKFGGDEYSKARDTFRNAVKKWKGREEELDKQAFGFYEEFRPSIPPGQKGWGRKGQLRLQSVRDVVEAG